MHATASEAGADGTTGFHTGEEHDLRSLKKMLLGCGGRIGLRSRSGSGYGIGDHAAAASAGTDWLGAHGGLLHAGRQRAVPGVAGRARAPRGLRLRASVPGRLHGELVLVDPLNWPDFDTSGGRRFGADPGRLRDRHLDLGQAGRSRPSSSSSTTRRAPTSTRSSSSWAGWSSERPPSTGGGDVDAADFCTKATSARSRADSIRLLGAVLELLPRRSAGRSAASHQDHGQGQPSAGGRLQQLRPR